MKRTGANLLALLAAVLFPLLIWVGLFVAIRPRLVRVARRVGPVVLAFLAGIFAPLLIWTGLFIALKERYQEWALKQSPTRTIGEIMEAAGLAVQGATFTEEEPTEVLFTPRPLADIHTMFARAGI